MFDRALYTGRRNPARHGSGNRSRLASNICLPLCVSNLLHSSVGGCGWLQCLPEVTYISNLSEKATFGRFDLQAGLNDSRQGPMQTKAGQQTLQPWREASHSSSREAPDIWNLALKSYSFSMLRPKNCMRAGIVPSESQPRSLQCQFLSAQTSDGQCVPWSSLTSRTTWPGMRWQALFPRTLRIDANPLEVFFEPGNAMLLPSQWSFFRLANAD